MQSLRHLVLDTLYENHSLNTLTLDPRLDLQADAHIWAVVLGAAKRLDVRLPNGTSLFGLLHGLRCGGTRLYLARSGKLKLDYTPLLISGLWLRDDLIRLWLEPATAGLKLVFEEAERQKPWGQGNQATLFDPQC